jgi:hypothetical protein
MHVKKERLSDVRLADTGSSLSSPSRSSTNNVVVDTNPLLMQFGYGSHRDEAPGYSRHNRVPVVCMRKSSEENIADGF